MFCAYLRERIDAEDGVVPGDQVQLEQHRLVGAAARQGVAETSVDMKPVTRASRGRGEKP